MFAVDTKEGVLREIEMFLDGGDRGVGKVY